MKKLLLFTTLLLFLTENNTWSQKLNTELDSVSYCLGINIANSFLSEFPEINLSHFNSGLTDALDNNKETLIAKDKTQEFIQQYFIKKQQLKQQKQKEEKEKQGNSTSIGELAPELNFPDPSGKIITLESLKGNYVLIDFWASWCKPCRMENPNVVKLYNKYKEKGFTVYSVSLDNNKDRWINAIKQDNLTWPNHVSDLKQWQTEATKIYGFRGIPYTVLIDKEGKIVAKNLRGPTLENKLGEIFGE